MPEFSDKAGFSFPGPPSKEALAFFKAKQLKVGFDYRDVWRQEHAKAFTVAKAMQLDLLADIKESLDKSLSEGIPFRKFAKDLTPLLQKKGWWGLQKMDDPLTGETKLSQLGSPRRLKTIYNANMRTAYAAGQYQRAQRVKSSRPYFVYTLGPSKEHRLQHRSWSGLTLPVDDPFWSSHYPPNGWGCKCRLRQISKQEYQRLKDDGSQTKAPKLTTREWTNKRTGEVERVPVGIDPGWDTSPGHAQARYLLHLSDKLNQAAMPVAVETVRQTVASPVFQQWWDAPSGDFPVATLKISDAELIGAKVQLARLSPATLEKQKKVHPDLDAGEYQQIQEAVQNGWIVRDGDLSLIYVLEDKGYVTVVKATKTGKAIFVTSFRRLSGKKGKRDSELLRLREKANK